MLCSLFVTLNRSETSAICQPTNPALVITSSQATQLAIPSLVQTASNSCSWVIGMELEDQSISYITTSCLLSKILHLSFIKFKKVVVRICSDAFSVFNSLCAICACTFVTLKLFGWVCTLPIQNFKQKIWTFEINKNLSFWNKKSWACFFLKIVWLSTKSLLLITQTCSSPILVACVSNN